MDHYQVPCEIASGEGETSSAVSQDELLAVDRSHCSSRLSYLTSSFFKLLSYFVQFLHFSRKATIDTCDQVLPNRPEIAFEEGETSSAIIYKNNYEVFLSFRGPDTRRGFADCIYHAMVDAGIRVFRDDDELALGDKIADILIALNNSKICMVLLSPTFAASVWCLREVERMVDMKKDIIPIFYDVTPDDVKLKTELYVNALTMHENKHGKEQVRKWREALKEIPTIKGRALESAGFVEFSRKAAKEILTKLKVKHKYEIENFVQVEDEVTDALKLLDIGSAGCRFLPIHGMGGIGKTTLAKIIFNQISDRFDCFCFLENIRENLSEQGGLKKLQEQLLRSIDSSLRDAAYIVDAIGKIKKKFTRKKVFIVLDDIDHKNHIRDLVGLFGSGSRIIFTTRNAKLHEQGTSFDAHFYGLEKKEMDSKQALKLFSRHAFGEDSPPEDFKSLSAEAISTTGGLPLALEVVGSFLHRRKAKVWRDVIKKLKEAPHQDVQARLMISYNALDDEQQEIFLDVACFFIGEEKRNAVYMWEACEFDPHYGIEVLISMSLIKLKMKNKKKCFWMHDQLRDLGRAIVKRNSINDKAGSRLWKHEEALDLLKTNVGKDKVEALHLGPCSNLRPKKFFGLEKLRYLRSSGRANIRGLFPKLRWLSLRNASSFSITNLRLRKIVVLELSWCSLDETWQGWDQILVSKQLKVLTLSHCYGLISMPDLSKKVNLERLSFLYCDKLTSIHSSIWKLQCLKTLRIIGCKFLHELPESIGRLISLTRLELDRAANIPNSIGKLVKLKHLSLRECRDLRVLPDSIGDLKLLISLDLGWSGIIELPSTIGRLAKLESLFLKRCRKLERLPDSIGNLHSLIDLDMSDTSIYELPHSFGNLASLQKLNLRGSSVRFFMDSFRGLGKLERIDIGYSYDTTFYIRPHTIPIGFTSLEIGCRYINGDSKIYFLRIDNQEWYIPLDGIEKLIKLEELSIQCYGAYSRPLEWGALQQLKSLKIECEDVEFRECQLPLSLESLDLKVSKQSQLPVNISSLKNLTKLWLWRFVIEEADSIQELESLKFLEMNFCILKLNCFPVLNRLEYLELKTCRFNFEESEFQIKLSNLENLSELSLTAKLEDDHNFELRPGFFSLQACRLELSNLKNLSKLSLCYYQINEERFKFDGLESLLDLKLSGCDIPDFGSVSLFKCSRSISLYECSFSKSTCLRMPQLDHLVELTLVDCFVLAAIKDIGKLKSLTKLDIRGCLSSKRIEGLSELNGLEYINIADNWCF